MNFAFETFTATLTTAGAFLVGILPTDPGTLEALAKWPVTLVLAAISIFCIHSMNKQAELYSKTQEKLSDSVAALAKNLAERPCIRHPQND